MAYLEIHGQIKVVEFIGVVDFYHLQNVLLSEAHRNVSNHQCRQGFLTIEHREKVNLVVCRVSCRWLSWNRVKHLLWLVTLEFVIIVSLIISAGNKRWHLFLLHCQLFKKVNQFISVYAVVGVLGSYIWPLLVAKVLLREVWLERALRLVVLV